MNFIDDEDKKIWVDFTKNIKKNNYEQRAENFFESANKIKIRSSTAPFIFNTKKDNPNHRVNQLHKKDFRGFYIERSLDLHGKTLDVATNYIDNFVKDCYLKQIRMALIITGKGEKNEGILKKTLPQLLKHYPKYIIGYCLADQKDGGEGAFYIRFRKRS